MKKTLAIAILALAFVAGGTWLISRPGGGPESLEIGAAHAQEQAEGEVAGEETEDAQSAGGETEADQSGGEEAEADQSGENQTQIEDTEGESAESDSGDAAEVDTSSIAEMTLGEEDAPVTVVEYASFTCPHCRNFHQNVFPEFKSNFIDTGDVQLIYREVYFDLPGLWASMIARCGGEQKFFGMASMLYEKQTEWVQGNGNAIADNLRSMGLSAGLTQDQVNACFTDSAKAQTLIAWFEENAEADNVEATPTFIIDGEKFEGDWSQDLLPAIEDAVGE